nr:hypothetical protein [Tanacetum cinerariifolium]
MMYSKEDLLISVIFMCLGYIHNHRDHLGKFDQKVDNESFLGYSPVAKAFRVFNIRRQELEETVHATFSEDDEAISQSNTEGDAINFNENRSFPDEPKKLIEALEEEGWITAMQKELNQFERNKVWTLKPHGKTIIRTKEIWKNKMDENGIVIKNKARLVAQVKFPTLPPNNLSPDESRISVNETLFRGMYQANPKKSHLVAVKRIFKYLKGTPNLGLWYHFIKDHILKGDIKLHFVPTNLQLADIFTKPLAEPSFTRLVAKLESTSSNQSQQVSTSTKVNFKCEDGVIAFNNVVALLEHPNELHRPMLSFLSNCWISKALTRQPSVIYVEYLMEFWYTIEGLEIDIELLNFRNLLASEVVLTSHMLKVAKLFQEPKQTLIPPSGEVNADDSADKSLSRNSVQPITLPNAPTDLKSKKKRIPPSSKPKSLYKVRVILPKKQVAETQHAEDTVATANASKSLVAFELVTEQVNQPSTADAKKDLLGSSLSKGFLLLRVIEEEVGDDVTHAPSGPQAFYGAPPSNNNKSHNNNNRGNHKTLGGNKNQGHGNGHQFNWAFTQNTVFGTCNRCGIGHISSQCPTNRDPSTIHTRPFANFVNSHAQSSNACANWHLDIRANSHMTPDLGAMENS